MLLQVCDEYPLLVINQPLCFVEYQQEDSMSRNVWRQYLDSPRSFAKLRLLEMSLKHNSPWNRFRSAVHYVADYALAKRIISVDFHHRMLIVWALFPGICLYLIIKIVSFFKP